MGKTLWGMPARLWALGRGANAGRGTGDRASLVRASLAGYGTGPTRRDLSSRKAASLAAFRLVLKPESRPRRDEDGKLPGGIPGGRLGRSRAAVLPPVWPARP